MMKSPNFTCNPVTINMPKVDVEELVKEFKVRNVEVFTCYLKEVWRDLAQRSDEKLKGVNKITFSKYYELPGIISERLYAVFDKNNNGYVDVIEFIEGMKILFSEGFDKTSKFIFDFYDFNKDGYVAKEEIRTVLSYVPLSSGKCEGDSYNDRVESQEELYEILEKCFINLNAELINYNQFLSIVENVCSDIYFFILVFLMEKKPFSRTALNEYEKQKGNFNSKDNNKLKLMSTINYSSPGTNKGLGGNYHSQNNSATKLVASPNLRSKFSPSVTMSKSPVLSFSNSKAFDLLMDKDKDKNFSKDFLRTLAGRSNKTRHKTTKENKEMTLMYLRGEKSQTLTDISSKIPVNRKIRNNLKNINVNVNGNAKQTEDIPSTGNNSNPSSNPNHVKNSSTFSNSTVYYNYNDLPITPAVKTNINRATTTNSNKISLDPTLELDLDLLNLKNSKNLKNSGKSNNSQISNNSNTNSNSNSHDTSEEEQEPVRCEGYLYKVTDTKRLKKLWFKLLDKDFYYFKNDGEQVHKGMHNLSGLYVKEEKPTVMENITFFCFSVTYPKKIRFYYSDTEGDMKRWVASIKQSTGYSDLTDIYEVKEKLGNGKFGLVRLGVHKLTGKKVAIKIMSKKDMNTQDLELVKTEIEILKVCQHPYIIRLIDVFENVDFVYVIMEFCSGGDLFSHIEKRGFKLVEPRACQLVHKLCTAIYYIHSYGIAHRDLKPENVLMTDSTDEADIRLLDFGLSKIIGPNETCTEPYGTLSYVAPEVLLEQPYTKAVDLWSIGITTYLILAGCLPFDHESSEREIARQTIHDPVRWGSIWKKISNEAKSFVENLLQKDPAKRMTIKEVLEHPWIQKYNKTSLPEQRKKSKDVHHSAFKLYASTDEMLNENQV